MTTIPLRIILQGLIALVPQNGPDGAKMTALLVDTTNEPADFECYMKHEPKIEFPTSSSECTAVDGCKMKTPAVCVCDLQGQEISILPKTDRGPAALDKRPPRVLPFSSKDAGNFAYVANLSELGYTINPAVLSTDPSLPPPPALVARFKFPFDTAAACDFATRRDDGADYVHATNTRPLGEEEKTGRNELSQAVAQKVETTVAIEVDSSAGQVLKLVLSPLPGRTGEVHEFKLGTNFAEVEITLANDRKDHFMAPDQLCDDGIGRDFAFFYDLVSDIPNSWAKRPVPHVKYSLAKSVADLFPLSDKRLCLPKKAPMSRPICPMASFY